MVRRDWHKHIGCPRNKNKGRQRFSAWRPSNHSERLRFDLATDNPIAASYEDAIALGLKRYFTGQPCKRGHIYFRNLKNHCIKCKNALEKVRVSHGPVRDKLFQYRRENKDVLRLKSKERYRKNPEPYKLRAKKWVALNPDAATESARKRQTVYRSKNREKSHINRRKQRARKLQNGGTHTPADIVAIFVSQRGKCGYCKKKVTMEGKHVDHIVPLIRGGSNDRRNLQILCPRCNLRKNAKDPIDYARAQGMLL